MSLVITETHLKSEIVNGTDGACLGLMLSLAYVPALSRTFEVNISSKTFEDVMAPLRLLD